MPSFRKLRLILAACCMAWSWAASAEAQVCGDPDGTGTVTVNDGVQVLRAAAGLSSPCTDTICNVDATGGVTINDGINVLRQAASLTANVTCGTEVSDFVNGVSTTDGQPATMNVGPAPIPGAGAPTTVGTPTGNSSAIAGGSNQVNVPFDAAAAAAAIAGDPNAVLVFSVADAQGNLFDGFYELPLSALSGQVTLNVTFPQNLGTQTFLLCPATRVNGELSNYAILQQDPIQVAAGSVQVTLSFQPSQDLDLHLVEPSGQEIFFGAATSPSGGTLDLDSNSGCSIDNVNNENITYPENVTPPAGQYIVRVDYFQSCTGGGADFTVVVNNGGVRSQFNGSFSASDADAGGAGSGREITRFTFPP